MEPNPKVIGSRISQKMMFSVAIFDLSFSSKNRLELLNLAYHEFKELFILDAKFLPNI